MAPMKKRAADVRTEFLEELAVASRKMRTLFDARVRAKGLTLARARTLMNLARKDGMTQSELAEILEIEGPTLVRLLDGLEAQGLTRRQPVEGDRRAKQIALTDAGRERATEVTRLAETLREDVLVGIPEADLLSATRIVRAITERIAATGCETNAA
ncbi:MAG: MarR family transcriptional regulator [Microvirga sp.]